MTETTYYGIAFIITVAVSLTLAAVAWRRRSVPGSSYFVLMMLSVGWWAFSYAMVALGDKPSLWVQLSTVGDCTMPVFFMLFALSYWRPDIRIRLQYQVLIWLIPVATIIITLTNDFHGLLWSEIPPSVENTNILLFEHGPWFYVTMIYGFLAMWVGVVFLFRAATSLSKIYRRQALIVLVAAVTPWIANALFLFNYSPVSGLNIAPIMASLTGLLLAFGIVKYHLFKVLPIAKEVVYKQIENGVLVVDRQGVVVDINPAAVKMLGGEAEAGRRIGTAIKDRLGLRFPLPAEHHRTEACLSGLDKPLYLDVVTAPLLDRHGRLSGHLIMLNDVSELRRTEDALRQGEEKYRFLTERMNDIVWTMGLDFKPIYTSSSIFKVLGFTPEERAGKTLKELVTPQSYEHIMNVFTSEMEREGKEGVDPNRIVTIEAEYYHKNGSIVWLEHMVSANRDQLGKIIGLYAVSRDITERKRAEEALRYSEERYRLLAENATDLIWASNINMKLTYISPSVSRLIGYTVEEAMALPMGKVYTPASAKAVIDVLKEEMEKERIGLGDPKRSRTVQAELYRKDGSIVHVEIIFSIVHDTAGKNVGTLAIARDITERKKTEEALHRLAVIVESSHDAILSKTLDGVITTWNRGAEMLYGYKAEEVVGRSVSILAPPELANEDIQFLDIIKRGEAVKDYETVRITRDKKRISILLTVSPLRDMSGDIIGASSIAQNITDLKQAAEIVKQSEKKYRELFENANEAIFVAQDDKLVFINPMLTKLFGYSAAELTAKPFIEFIYPDDKGLVIDRHKRRLMGESLPPVYAFRVVRRDGAVRWVELSAVLIEWEGRPATLNFLSDITEHREAEQRVRQVAEEWQTTFDSISDMVSIQDRDYKIVRLNKAYADAVGMKIEDVIGRHCHEVVHNAASHIINCPHHRTIETKKAMIEEVFEPRLGAYLEVSTSPIFDKSGEVIGTVHIAKNINARKRAEKLIGVRLSLLEYAATHSLEELLQKTLDEVGDLTESPIGFYHFVEKDQKTLSLQAWSTRTVNEFCKAEGRGMHYGIDKAGVWVDCVRQRRPVVHNDYSSLPHKKGLPDGHAPVIRELVVPIMRGGNVVAVLGVGNKPTDYIDTDIETVSYLADVAWEITRRKQAETAVSEERRRLSDILRGTNVGTWEWNVQTGETVFNERWAEIIGYTLDELSPVNIETWVKFGHPDDLKRSGELLEKHFKGELDYYECEARMRHKDGRWVWVLDRGRVHSWTDDGKPLWMSGTHQDITERKHMEEVLSASEEKLRLTFESIADGIVIIDLAGNVVDVNEATVRISGYRNKSQIIGRDAFDLLAPTDRRLALEDLKERVEGRPKERVEYSICPKDGRSFEAELTASTLRDENGSPIGYIAVIRDITERKLAEEALRQSEQKFRELADLLPQTIIEIDDGGHFTYANRYAFESTGYGEEDIERGINAVDLFVPEQRDMVLERIGRILSGEKLDVDEYRIVRKDGSVYTALIYTNAVMRDGKPSGIRAVVVDISERKKVEQMKTDFVAFISHQLRTPTAGLMGYIDNMLDGITGELNSKQAEYLGEMRDVCARNNRLIADLLNISRLERGVLAVNIKPVSLGQAVDTAVKEHSKSIEEKGVALSVRGAERDVTVHADIDKLVEVLKNVLHNAYKFTKEGWIDIEISSSDKEGIIKIRDSGIGMSEENVKDLFKKEKVFGGAISAGGGAGLGLYIAKGFMKLQGGDIIVESAEGKGSTFTISIPKE